MPKTEVIKLVPTAGMVANLYGKGFGYCVRGLVVAGQIIFYLTEEEQKAKFDQEQRDIEFKKAIDYEQNQEEFNIRIGKLPVVFQERIHDFRDTSNSWGQNFETYELFVCEQAYVFAKALKTLEKISEFKDLEFKAQKKIVPELSNDHSGNTFAAACLLAQVYLREPNTIPKVHGVLCPLVGCKEYGCFCVRQ